MPAIPAPPENMITIDREIPDDLPLAGPIETPLIPLAPPIELPGYTKTDPETGVVAEFWSLAGVEGDFRTGQMAVRLEGYVSPEAQADRCMKPVITERVVVDPAADDPELAQQVMVQLTRLVLAKVNRE